MMNKSFLKKIKDTLIAQKQEILKQTTQEINVDTDGDETDEVQGNMLIQLNNQLNNRNANKLNQIETALKRIEDKSYGLCQDCGEPIAEKRLLHNPHFQNCVSCAEEHEAEEKQRKKL